MLNSWGILSLNFISAMLPIFVAAAEWSTIKPRFSFDISDENVKGDSRKLAEAAMDRMAYSRYELKIQLELVKEFKRIATGFDQVFGDEMMKNFIEMHFFQNGINILYKEIHGLLRMVNTYNPKRAPGEMEMTFRELHPKIKPYFPRRGTFPIPESGLSQLQNWHHSEFAKLYDDEFGHLIEPINLPMLSTCFSVARLSPVLVELHGIIDARVHGSTSNVKLKEYFFDERARIDFKNFLGDLMTEKNKFYHADNEIEYIEEFSIAYYSRRMDATKWGRLHFEVFWMRLNAVMFLLNGLGGYIQREHPPHPVPIVHRLFPIQSLQNENRYARDYSNMAEKHGRIAKDCLELANQFMVTLGDNGNAKDKKGKKEKDGKEKKDKDKKGGKGQLAEERPNIVSQLISDHDFMDWWNAPTKIKEEENWNWLGLDAGDLLAFEHYTRKKYDRHNWGMVLQRQLLTEIGALKIVQDYLEKKQMAALGDKSKKKDGKDGKDKKKKQSVEEEDEAAIVQNADFAPELQ